MKTDKRKITGQNFSAFATLMHAVHKTALNKCLDLISEGTGNDIAIKISELTNDSPSGKTLCKYTEAVLKEKWDIINPQLPILHGLARYILISKGIISKEENKNYPYWFDYEAMVLSESEKQPNKETTLREINEENPSQNHVAVNSVSLQKQPVNESKNLDLKNIKPALNKKSFLKAGIFGGACAGFFGVLVIAVLRYFETDVPLIATGYENISKAFFFQRIFPVVFLFQIAGGAFLGWLCCYYALKQTTIFKNILFFLAIFLVMFLLRQTTVRNSWMPVGEHVYFDEKGNKIIFSGGPLGEPDFECIAAALMGAVSLIIFSGYIRKRLNSIASEKNILNALLLVIIPGVCGWCFVYVVFKLVTHFGIIKEDDFFISKAVFYFKFPHAERVLLVTLLCAIYVYAIISAIKYQERKTIL